MDDDVVAGGDADADGDNERGAHPGGAGSPWSVEWVSETGSTNADVLARSNDGHAEGLVLIADYQTHGRGRLERRWIAPAGSGLLVSVLLRPRLALSQMHLAVIAVALAAADATEAVTGIRPLLKWPNDLLGVAADGRTAKLGGILAEAGAQQTKVAPGASSSGPSDGSGQRPLVVGMGLNLHRPADLPAEIGDRAIYLDELSPSAATITRDQVVAAWLVGLSRWYFGIGTSGGQRELIGAWRADLDTLGRNVRAQQPGGDVTGRAIDVTQDVALVVETNTGRTEVHAGDVIHLRSS